jgi:hypothetical protein
MLVHSVMRLCTSLVLMINVKKEEVVQTYLETTLYEQHQAVNNPDHVALVLSFYTVGAVSGLVGG